MDVMSLDDTVRNINERLGHVEQILPTLATKEELDAAVAKLATKDELAAAVAKLATKEELAAAVATLATKEELREEGRQIRRETRVLFESLRNDIHIVAEGVIAVQRSLDGHTAAIRGVLANHEHRITALELGPPPGRQPA